MKILAFVYDFPHFKSAQGLFALKRAGFDDVVAVGAPYRRLNIKESFYQFRTMDMDDAHHPRETCKALGYRYEAMPHEQAWSLLQSADVGLVLGARVLPGSLIEDAPPVINIHPGVLPLNRGLDTLKWAVHDDLPQAIAVHVIDSKVDRGELIFEEIIRVNENDSPADVYNRLMWRQMAAIPTALSMLDAPRFPIGKGIYRRPMTLEEDVAVMGRFPAYRVRYDEVCAAYENRNFWDDARVNHMAAEQSALMDAAGV
jgi:folate-dependent phosphoribosylglycinamide formyltransferase PurN